MDFKEIGHISRGALDLGKMRIQSDGLTFKSSERTVHVKHSEIDLAEWLRVARGYELKVISREGHVFKFSGFKEADFVAVRDFFKQNFGKDLKQVELCVKGWNWGEPIFKGSLLTFLVDSKPAFEIPLEEVSRVTAGKNEVSLEFHQNDTAAVSLMEMRFHVPTTGTDSEEDPVQSFHDKIQAKADVLQATGNAIASFSEMQCLTPRGRYTIKVYPTFLGAHGKTFDYKMPFTTITRCFLLPHNDNRQLFLVLGLDPPIRQGQTRYPFFIVQMQKDETCELTLAMSEEELKEKYGGKLNQELEGPLYEVFARLMKVLVGKKMIVPGNFKNNNGQHAVSCSCKATSGFLYPLDRGFIFVHKPAIFIKFEDIANVNFARMSSGGMSRSFDFDIETKEGVVHHFSSLMKDDYTRLHEFVTEKRLKIKDKGNTKVSYNDELSGESSDEHDPYLARMKAEGEQASSEDDSDFVAKESGSDDDLEYDSDAPVSDTEGDKGGQEKKVPHGGKGSGSDEDEEEEEEEVEEKPKAKKRGKPQAATKSNPPKRRKQVHKEKGEEKGKKEKKKKDPNCPKKPLSSYMLWMQEMRPSLKKKYPELSITEMSKKAGEMWKALVDKSKWEEKAKKLKEQYQRDKKEYERTGKAPSSSSSSAVKRTAAHTGSKKQSSSKKPSQYKSEEFVDTDESSNEDKKEEEEEEEAEMTDDGDDSD